METKHENAAEDHFAIAVREHGDTRLMRTLSVTPLIAYTKFVVGCKQPSEYALCVCSCQHTVKRLEFLVLG